MKISIIGSGYVGLVTAGCLADHGNQVICADSDANKIAQLNDGTIPFFEPGLEDIVGRNLRGKRLRAVTELATAVKSAQIHFLCVGTPYVEKLQTLDTTTLLTAGLQVAELAQPKDLLVIKSTVPVGTAIKLRKHIQEKTGRQMTIVSNPEFLKEGNAVEDFMKPDRIVIGCEEESGPAANQMVELYTPFVRTGNPILTMDNNSAEMVKLASNGYLATRISYMNEIANLCESSGANVAKVRLGMGFDNRIGHRYLFPGLGYGGSCFPKDIQALMHLGDSMNSEARILSAVHRVNLDQRRVFLDKVRKHFGGHLQGKKIAVWGLSFKPNTDDVRDAPSLDILKALIQEGAQVVAYDPEAMARIRELFANQVTLCENNYDCLEGADALCILTEWGVFRNPDFNRMRELMRASVIFDGRNLYSPQDMQRFGFNYFYMGQPHKN